jgi:phosphoenolpyruvate carboxykinase (GTP)
MLLLSHVSKWMELRVHGDLDAIETPTGYTPVYEDLRNLFKKYLNKEF